jgi:hypothetical protein
MAGGTCGLSTLYHTPGIDTDDVRIGGGGAYDGVGWYSVVLVQHFLSNATIFIKWGCRITTPKAKVLHCNFLRDYFLHYRLLVPPKTFLENL